VNRLDRLSVRGFKSIRELDLELGTVNVLIGGNGAGKSNLLSLLRMVRATATGGMQEWVARAGGARSVLHYGPKVTPALEVGIDLQAGSDAGSYRVRLAPSPSDTLVFLEEAFGIASQGTWQLSAARSEGLLEDYAANGDPAACVPRRVLGGCCVFQFHDTSASARIRAKAYINDNQRLHGDGGNLAAFLHALRHSRPPY